jgi:uncharacterized protein YjbJ (UPF0337 family)
MKEMFQGGMQQIRGKIKEKWGDITDDDIMRSQGNMDQLAGTIQQKYGGSKEDIRRQLDQMMGKQQ